MTLLLHCDLVYAGDNAQLSLPFVNLGLVPEAASSLLLPRLAGHVRAADKLMFGEPFGAVEAQQMGLVNAVLPATEVNAFAAARAKALAAKPLASLVATKALMKQPIADAVPRRCRPKARTSAGCCASRLRGRPSRRSWRSARRTSRGSAERAGRARGHADPHERIRTIARVHTR